MATNKTKDRRLSPAVRSLQKMLEDMSPFLPKRDIPPTGETSDWKITQPAPPPRATSRKRD